MSFCLVRKEVTCFVCSSSGVTSASISKTHVDERLRGFCGNQKTDTKQVGDIVRDKTLNS